MRNNIICGKSDTAQTFLCTTILNFKKKKNFWINCRCQLWAIPWSVNVRIYLMYLVMVYLAMLSVVQTEQDVSAMLGQSASVNSPYQSKGKYSYQCRSTNTYFLQYSPMMYLPKLVDFWMCGHLKTPCAFSSKLKLKKDFTTEFLTHIKPLTFAPLHLKLCDRT